MKLHQIGEDLINLERCLYIKKFDAGIPRIGYWFGESDWLYGEFQNFNDRDNYYEFLKETIKCQTIRKMQTLIANN